MNVADIVTHDLSRWRLQFPLSAEHRIAFCNAGCIAKAYTRKSGTVLQRTVDFFKVAAAFVRSSRAASRAAART